MNSILHHDPVHMYFVEELTKQFMNSRAKDGVFLYILFFLISLKSCWEPPNWFHNPLMVGSCSLKNTWVQYTVINDEMFLKI